MLLSETIFRGRWTSVCHFAMLHAEDLDQMSTLSFPEGSRIAASKDQVSCDLAGEAAILNLKSGVYFGLDPVGARVWSLLQKPVTLAEICDTLTQEYDVERDRLEADLRELISDLTEHGLVQIAE